MATRTWEKTRIMLEDGTSVEASCPVIISASRATDIPAFYAKWFLHRLQDGYTRWTNPFNARQIQYISFEKTRAVVFWSKNPRPLMEYLPDIDKRGMHYYFQFTLNHYEKDLEPDVPPLEERIQTFKELSKRIGKSRVIWRFDPLLLTDTLTVDELVRRVTHLADALAGYTEKLVISFADIATYRKVERNLERAGIHYKDFTNDEIDDIAGRLSELRRTHGLVIATCAEGVDLQKHEIEHNKCIDDQLLIRLFPTDAALMAFLGHGAGEPTPSGPARPQDLKDRGQRKECGCIISKDIGTYNTCPHHCTYCYANASRSVVDRNHARHMSQGGSSIDLVPVE